MAVLIRGVACKSLFSFWGQRKVLSCEIFLWDFDLVSLTAERDSPFLNCSQVSNLFKEFLGKLTLYKLCSKKVRYCYFIDGRFYTFLIEFSRKIGKCARSETDNFCHVLSRVYLWERIRHDPVSVMWIPFNGKLMDFRTNIFKKQVFCLLFVHSSDYSIQFRVLCFWFNKFNLLHQKISGSVPQWSRSRLHV